MKFTIEFNSEELITSINNGVLLALAETTAKTDTSALNAAEIIQEQQSKKQVEETSQADKTHDSTTNGNEEIITIEDVRAAFVAKNSKGNREKLKSILNDFGVTKVTDLKEEDFPKVLKALEAI